MGLKSLLRRVKARDLPSPMARRKLLRGIQRIGRLSDDELRSTDALLSIIRGVGLRYDERPIYGDEARHMNATKDGLWQIPAQLAGAMVVLADLNIKSFLEVGTHSGYTFSVLAAYLHRLNGGLTALTIDPFPLFRHYQAVRKALPVEYRRTTSDELQGQAFDCVLIDGDHSYEAAKQDFQNVGRHARVCMFHDINDDLVGQQHVPRLWRELVDSHAFDHTHEFLDCEPGKRVMGIGLGVTAA